MLRVAPFRPDDEVAARLFVPAAFAAPAFPAAFAPALAEVLEAPFAAPLAAFLDEPPDSLPSPEILAHLHADLIGQP